MKITLRTLKNLYLPVEVELSMTVRLIVTLIVQIKELKERIEQQHQMPADN